MDAGHKGGRKTTVTVLYSYSYKSRNNEVVSILEGERLILVEKTNKDWWQVRRPGEQTRPFYAPANYLLEDGTKHKSKLHAKDDPKSADPRSSRTVATNLSESKSDDCLQSPGRRSPASLRNAEFRKQRSTSMDAIMFLELLENEIKDMPTSSSSSSQFHHQAVPGHANNSRNLHHNKIEDKYKKPRISKDPWDRRKSWAVEEAGTVTWSSSTAVHPSIKVVSRYQNHQPVLTEEPRKEMQSFGGGNKSSPREGSDSVGIVGGASQVVVAPPPRPPRSLPQSAVQEEKTCDKEGDKLYANFSGGDDKAPALPPKKSKGAVFIGASGNSFSSNSSSGSGGNDSRSDVNPPEEKRDNYSKVTPLRINQVESNQTQSQKQAEPTVVVVGSNSTSVSSGGTTSRGANSNSSLSRGPKLSPGIRQLSESLEKLAQQIQVPAKSTTSVRISPVTGQANGNNNSNSSSGNQWPVEYGTSPPDLPPKKVTPAKPTVTTKRLHGKTGTAGSFATDNYVNLLRPITVVDTSPSDDIQSDESGINMSFNNPLFGHKEDRADKGSNERLGSSQDLESSLEDATSLKALKIRTSLSSSELEGNEASSSEDMLSSKDSLNSIPGTPTKTESSKRSLRSTTSLKLPLPDSPRGDRRPNRELFEGWAEYVDDGTCRPFYYNRETRARSWKPPRRSGPSPRMRGISIEEETFDDQRSNDDSFSEPSTINRENEPTRVTPPPRLMASTSDSLPVRHPAMLPPVPDDWITSIDPESEEVFYTHSITGARWYTSSDSEGRLYYYEENSNESLWTLPKISSTPQYVDSDTRPGIQQGVFYPEGSHFHPPSKSKTPSVTVSVYDPPHQRTFKEFTKADRNIKTRSMAILTNFSGNVEDIPVETRESLMAKTASLPRNIPQWPTLQAGSIVSDYLTNLDIRVLQQGVLQKTKLTENGKKLRKNWSSSLVVLTDLFLFIFKETKNSSHTSITSANKPELCVDLNGATIEWASVKSSRKGVFQVTTLLGLQLLLQDEDETNAVVWFNQIRRAIQRLPCGSRETMNIYPSPLPSPMTSQPKWPSQDSNRPEVLSSHLLSPPSPDGVESLAGSLSKQKNKGSRLRRTRSTKVRILGSTEDLTAASSTSTASPVERQIKLRDKLRKFFVRRPTMESLKRKGIWKDEPVFGCHLQNLCAGDDTLVPKFVQRVVQLIESKPDNMKADGIYRASGNLSQVQKIRCQVDQNNWKVLEEEEDVHVLTGCLKLFFRELKEPLIPFATFEKALEITNSPSGADKIRKFKDLMENLSRENYETLRFLLKHLLNITKYREHNRMHISNLAIVFGPTITWAATESFNLALDMMQQNLVVESLLNNYMNIFT